ncbi:MAG TPA: hypothetical protein VM533_07925 [Fimbriiglobus sp.]|jgi:hypothetical protein|nr:hypothetical protein [Fimbriiglobus sp.]
MRRSFLLAVAALMAAAGTLSALQPPAPPVRPGRAKPPDPPKKDEPPPPPPKRENPDGPPEFEAKFVDDSVLKVAALESVLTVSTKYGKLTVPLAEVVRLEVGFRFPEGVEAQVEQAVGALGAPAFREREDAEKALFKLAEYAVPALRRAAKHTDPEVSRRAGSLLKRLTDKLPEEKMALKDFDLVETTEATVRGRVETLTVKVKNRVLGETALKLADLRSLRSTAAVGNEFTVEARYARQNDPNWHDTGLDVTNDQPLEITADGSVDLAPQNPGQYISGPGGNPNNGNTMFRMPNGGGIQAVPGALYARIGPNGSPFLVGTSHKSNRPSASGRLYLKIGPTNWGGVDPTGGYKVKVRVGG